MIAPQFPLMLSLCALLCQFVNEDFVVALAFNLGTIVPGSIRLLGGPQRLQLFVALDILDSILVTSQRRGRQGKAPFQTDIPSSSRHPPPSTPAPPVDEWRPVQ